MNPLKETYFSIIYLRIKFQIYKLFQHMCFAKNTIRSTSAFLTRHWSMRTYTHNTSNSAGDIYNTIEKTCLISHKVELIWYYTFSFFFVNSMEITKNNSTSKSGCYSCFLKKQEMFKHLINICGLSKWVHDNSCTSDWSMTIPAQVIYFVFYIWSKQSIYLSDLLACMDITFYSYNDKIIIWR